MPKQLSQAAGRDLNRDPITGEPGAHPVGTGVGAAAGGAAAAATGAIMGGPVGAAVGAVAGAIIGGLAGKATAEDVDPTFEDAYWQKHYATRPYYSHGEVYELYAPAYRFGWESRAKHANRSFDEVEQELQSAWGESKITDKMSWEKARPAIHDAWHRTDQLDCNAY
jgi:phage tail tape-measure protein